MTVIIDGNKRAARIKQAVKERAAASGAKPALAVVLAGRDAASLAYIRGKKRACADTGIDFRLFQTDSDITRGELVSLIEGLNGDDGINGIIVEQPLPAHLDKNAVLSHIAPHKDIDCLNPLNAGLAAAGVEYFENRPVLPACTPAGIIRLLIEENIRIEGRHAVIIGRSDIVGKPLAMLMLKHNATVTVCHSRTANLAEHARSADILVAAVGRPRFVTADMLKEGCVVVDVGINYSDQKTICGDADFEGCAAKASYITPVPGGVGPMTAAMLTEHCFKAWEAQNA